MLNIKNARKAKKLSQAVVAELLDVTQATFSGWETGKYEIDNNSLIKLSDILDTTTDYLLGKTDTPHIINHINVLSPIFDKYNKLNLLDQKKVDTYIDDLLENRKYTDKIVEIKKQSDIIGSAAALGGNTSSTTISSDDDNEASDLIY